LFWNRGKSEVEFLREQVKELQTQVIILAGKQYDYVNTKIALEPAEAPKVMNPLTGNVETQQAMTDQEKKDFEMSKEEFASIFNYQRGSH
jgi:hypothetical protein